MRIPQFHLFSTKIRNNIGLSFKKLRLFYMGIILLTWALSTQAQDGTKVHVEDNRSLFNGAATYSYPIEIPPGTGGMQPRISLEYNSQSTWSRLGYGWSISGFDHIGRSTKKGIPFYGTTNEPTDFVGEWNFENNYQDTSSNNNDGTAVGTGFVTYGYFGSAAEFDSTTDTIYVGNNPPTLTMSDAFTISVWINPDDDGVIVSKEGEYQIGLHTDNTIRYALKTTTPGWAWQYTNVAVSNNEWSHIVWTYDKNAPSSQINVYLNGALVHSKVGSGSVGDQDPTMNAFHIGKRECCPGYYNGLIDEVRVYNRALSQTEARDIFRNNNIAYAWNGGELLEGEDGKYHTEREGFIRIEKFNSGEGPEGNCHGSYWMVTDRDGSKSVYGCNNDSNILRTGEGGPYIRELSISHSGAALADYQIKVTLDTADMISSSKMKADCGDVRFRDSDGTTVLPHWLESGANSTSTIFWVNVPSIPNGGKSIYMTYGDPSAQSQSDGDATFVLFDDFSGASLDTSKWTETASNGSYTIASSTLTISSTSNIYLEQIESKSTFGLGYAMRANMDPGPNGFYRAQTGWSNPGNTSTASAKFTCWVKDYIRSGNNATWFDDSCSYTSGLKVYEIGRISVSENKYFVNDSEISTSPLGNGVSTARAINFSIKANGSTDVDWIAVRKITSTEPTISVGAEAEIERRWALDKVTDTNGNYYKILYTEDQDNGDYYPDKIIYTFNDGGSITAYRSLLFNWEARTDVRTSYAEGARETIDQRLSSIEVLMNTDVNGGGIGAVLLHKYNLDYEYKDGKSFLKEIEFCGTDGNESSPTCLPATKFDYDGGVKDFDSDATKEDWGSGQGTHIITDDGTHKLIDINGDGLIDDVYRTGGGNYQVNLNQFGDGTQNKSFAAADPAWGSGQGSVVTDPDGTHDLIDMNGDGLVDDVRRSGSGNYDVRLNNGSGFDTTVKDWGSGQGNNLRESTIKDLIDMNKDGLPDDVYRSGTGDYSVRLNTGVGFDVAVSWGDGQGSNLYTKSGEHTIKTLIDMNGDGLPDDVYRSGTGDYSVRLNTGTEFAAAENWGPTLSSHVIHVVSNNVKKSLVDINGDGLPDEVRRVGTGTYDVLLNSGSGFIGAIVSWDDGQWNNISHTTVQNNTEKALIDINGDGLPDDIKRFNTDNYSVWLNKATADRLLSKVTLPTGGLMEYKYAPANQFDNRDDNEVHRLSFPMWVVTSITTNDGLNPATTATTTYSYKGGCYVETDKEFRGFNQVTETDPSEDYTITFFNQSDELYGTISAVERWDWDSGTSSASLVSLEEYSYESVDTLFPPTKNLRLGINFVRLNRVVSKLYDDNPTAYETQTDYTYDDYGNVTITDVQGDISVSNDENKTTVAYINNESLWIFGLSKQETVEGYNGTTLETRRDTKYYYDGLGFGNVSVGNLSKVESWLDSPNPASWIVTGKTGYDTYGNVIWTKDANVNNGGPTNSNGYTAEVSFDSTYKTYAVSATDAMDHTTTTGYDSRMRPDTITDPNGNVTTTEYDVFSRVTKVIGPNDTSSLPTIQTTYYDDGTAPEYILTQTREVSGQSDTLDSYEFMNGFGSTIQTKSEGSVAGDWITVDHFSDPVANTSSKTVPYITTAVQTSRDSTQDQVVTTVDALGRTIDITSTDGTNVTITYDQDTTTVTNELNQQKVTVSDAYGRPTSITQNDGTVDIVTSYNYHTATGEMLEITEPRGNKITFIYDSFGRKTSMTDPDLGTWDYSYDENGNLLTQTDALGMDTDMTYDALNRVTLKESDPSDDLRYSYVYGAHNDSDATKRGRLLSVTGQEDTSNIFTRTFTYDNIGRTLSTQLSMDGYTWTTSSTYDAMDRVVTTTLPDGEMITNTYNLRGSLKSVSGKDDYLDEATYLPSGAIATLDYGNTTIITYDYDDTDATPSYRLDNVSVSGGNVDFDLTYGYDSVGNITSIDDSIANKDQTFTYDGINRLLTANGVYGSKTYSYDKAGNILSKDGATYSYDSTRNRLNSEGGWTYNYDTNGNITSRTKGPDTQYFDYDSLNRLIEFDDLTNVEQYEYDEGENRLKKVEDGKTTYYISGAYEEIYDGSTLDETIIRYGNYAIRDGEGLKYRYSDHLGSSARLANPSGTETLALWNAPFGVEASSSGTVSLKYKYTGKELDPSGLYYYGARYYDPELGRFMSADSILPDVYNSQGLNRYAYVLNNPLSYNDPDGHFWNLVVGGILTAVGIGLNVAIDSGVIPDDSGLISLAADASIGVGSALLPVGRLISAAFKISQKSGNISGAIVGLGVTETHSRLDSNSFGNFSGGSSAPVTSSPSAASPTASASAASFSPSGNVDWKSIWSDAAANYEGLPPEVSSSTGSVSSSGSAAQSARAAAAPSASQRILNAYNNAIASGTVGHGKSSLRTGRRSLSNFGNRQEHAMPKRRCGDCLRTTSRKNNYSGGLNLGRMRRTRTATYAKYRALKEAWEASGGMGREPYLVRGRQNIRGFGRKVYLSWK